MLFRSLMSGSSDHALRMWNITTGEELQVLQGHEGVVRSVAFSPDGQNVASGSDDDTVRIWDIETGAQRISPSRWRELPLWERLFIWIGFALARLMLGISGYGSQH